MEVLTEKGQLVGKRISKVEAHRKGICHGISAVALIDDKGRLLLQKRSETKEIEPGKWDLSGAGHIDIYETPDSSAVRELYEELHIQVNEEDLVCIDTYLNQFQIDEEQKMNHYTYLYLVRKNINITDVIIQESEVSEVKFVDKKEFIYMLNKNQMVEAMKYCNLLLDYLR